MGAEYQLAGVGRGGGGGGWGWAMGEIWVTVKRGFCEFGRAGILADGFTLRDCYSMCARSAYGCLVLYTIFDAFVRSSGRSFVRSFAKIACFLTVLKVASSRREQILR